ncbi:MAG TPA: DEAD/DEAH box helicase [Stellaceae bacterium]|nr:DEAD/DEAH box helicase [Stellaceae bacterium]
MSQTIQETIEELHAALRDYVEATYHISSPALIDQRRELLDLVGVIHQEPYIESTPRYQSGEKFEEMAGLPQAALEVFQLLAKAAPEHPALIYNPPYKHQSQSVSHALVRGKNLLIMTGTGSGKTESFLLPILGKLAREAKTRGSAFASQTAVRALILYPMNALVNDQLGRLRALFGDRRLVELFKKWTGRPPRFARYTSRTPYAGVRTSKKDSVKLKAFEEFYVDIQRRAAGPETDEQTQAADLLRQLKERGKWPAKPDLVAWFGKLGTNWQNQKTKEFKRAIALSDDSELLTRHEVQIAPPDLLVTNYSMLEYMLIRPIERPIFDHSRSWLAENPDEKFLIVLDEAHLYRGAAGAEVGLLLRRLRDRLDVRPERFQVICATASFKNREYAPAFGSQLSGVPAETFVAISGELDLRKPEGAGSVRDAEVLSRIDMDAFYNATTDADREAVIRPLLEYRDAAKGEGLERDLYHALSSFPPMGLLVNETMKGARRVKELGPTIFGKAGETSDRAVTRLMALGSIARIDPKGPGLLPCRIHNFFRGLPGLWICMDPNCSEIPEHRYSGIGGKLYGQPKVRCDCGARVLELFTCRYCGTAYARAYTNDVDNPSALWSEPGHWLKFENSDSAPLLALDLLLEEPKHDDVVEAADYDIETGRLNPKVIGPRMRRVFLRRDRVMPITDEDGNIDPSMVSRGQFVPCAVCREKARFGRSTVQDHQTKGDQPFQALVARQIQIQPPGAVPASRFAPLRGRKVLIFSDSRQVAARLAPNLQMYSVRDSLRPLIAWGMKRLQAVPGLLPLISLEDLYLAVLLASKKLGVRLRPELKSGEGFGGEDTVEHAVRSGEADTDAGLHALCLEMRSERPPEALLDNIVTTVQDRFLGLEALALASIVEKSKHTPAIEKLPNIPGVAETPEAKRGLARAWLRCWESKGFWLNSMPQAWWRRPRTQGTSIQGQKSKFSAMDIIITDKSARKIFSDKWHPELLRIFTEEVDSGYRRLRGSELSLLFDGQWERCLTCKSVHRPIPGLKHCVDCRSPDAVSLDPNADQVFGARKGYYRNPVIAALGDPPKEPMALIAAEHTAQLNAPQNEDVFSKAEENELLFQDVPLTSSRHASHVTAIDVLSSTTTMEVGIDIGALSGVALRNMPPGRANYQQRAGRAGRRGNAVATVVAFSSVDSHDEHYFTKPDGMIRGDVVDPRLTLDNREITRRHIRAFLLQNYHQERLPQIDPSQPHDLFSVLGTVSGFRSAEGVLNRADFAAWLESNEQRLKTRIASWIPVELSADDRTMLLEEMKADCLGAIDEAIKLAPSEIVDEEEDEPEDEPEEGEEQPHHNATTGKLLDRLLYRGVLPRYAFPTDVATFHVFDRDRSTDYRPIMRFAPSQGLPVALSQYAPGKQIWISGKCYTSAAIYSTMQDERFDAWERRRIYRECTACGFAETVPYLMAECGELLDCRACGGESTFGPARTWLRPPGFAHPVDVDEVTSPDDLPETSYATRAKLTMPTPADETRWLGVNERVRVLKERQHLLVSNTGPSNEGYSYCARCGRIEASSNPTPTLLAPHQKPYPNEKEPICEGNSTIRHLVLGTDFITDIALFSMKVEPPLSLKPGYSPTDVVLRTVSEALAKAACEMLEIEPSELMAEYRPALTAAGRDGLEAEIFLYDTLPGGAGFASQLIDRGRELLERALALVKVCPENCDASCYRCLRSFKNKFEHGHLDRHIAIGLLEYLLTGKLPGFDAERLRASTALLCSDLERQSDGVIQIEANKRIAVAGVGQVEAPILITKSAGRQFVVAISHPLMSGCAADAKIRDVQEKSPETHVILVNELLVRGNLPAATRAVYAGL